MKFLILCIVEYVQMYITIMLSLFPFYIQRYEAFFAQLDVNVENLRRSSMYFVYFYIDADNASILALHSQNSLTSTAANF